MTGTFANVTSTGGTNGVTSTPSAARGGGGRYPDRRQRRTFHVDGGSSNITWSGTLTKTGATLGRVVDISNTTGGTITFQTGTVSNNSSSGTGVSLFNADGNVSFNGGVTLSGGQNGISVASGSAGTFTFASSSSITDPTNTVIAIDGSSSNFTYSGTFTKTNNNNTGITISSNTGGTININGTGTKTLSTGTGIAISIGANTAGVTINFSGGGLSVTTTTGIAVNATGAGTLTFTGASNTITAGNTGLLVNGLGLGTSALANVTTTGGTEGISLTNTTGTLNISGGNISGATGFGILGSTFGTLNISGMTINNAAGGGMSLTTGALSGTFTSFSSTGGTHGLLLSAVSGTFSAAAGTISNPTTAGISITGLSPSVSLTGTISINNGRPGIITSNMTGGSITVSTVNVSGALAGQDAITLDGTGSAVDLSINSATLNTTNMDDGLVLSDLGLGTDVTISGGSITSPGVNHRVFELTGTVNCNCNLATVTLSGNSSDGISLPSTHQGTYQFGDTTLNTPNGGIGVQVVGDANTANTDSSVTFRSINIATCTQAGIWVHSHSGTFSVNGTGGAGSSGGTISNCTQRGARFGSVAVGANGGAKNITLTDMTFNNNGTANLDAAGTCGDDKNATNTNCAANIDFYRTDTIDLTDLVVIDGAQIGINGNRVSDLDMANVEVNSAGNEALEDGIQMAELTGTSDWSNVNSHDNASRQVAVQNGSGTGVLNITNSQFHNATYPTLVSTPASTTAAQGILYSGHGTANMTLNIQTSSFTRNFGAAVFSDTESSAAMDFTVNGGTITGNGLAIQVAGVGSGVMDYTLSNAQITVDSNAATGPISFFRGAVATGNWSGSITGNQLGTSGVSFSGSPCNTCVGMIIENSGSGPGNHNVTISGNTIRQTGHTAIDVRTSGPGAIGNVGNMNAKILNNNISEPAQPASTDSAIQILAGDSVAGDTSNVCVEVTGNTITNGGFGNAWNPVAFILMGEFNVNVLRIPTFGGGTGATAATFVSGLNSGAPTSIVDGTDNFIGGGATCF